MAKLEHVVAERDNDELRVLRPVLDVVRDDGNVSEVESRIDLVHKVQGRGLDDDSAQWKESDKDKTYTLK
jgi:hypothetical protein